MVLCQKCRNNKNITSYNILTMLYIFIKILKKKLSQTRALKPMNRLLEQ